MKILAKQNRELIMTNAQNTQNENNAEKITLQVPEQYEDFNKKIVFVTPDGNVWDIITNNEYLIPKAITKYKQVDLYIWLTKGDVDFRSQTRTLKFYHNVDASGEITPEEISGVNTVVNLLEEEITKVENLESQVDGKLEEVDTAIDNIHTAIQETENLDLDAEKEGQTTTVTLTNGEDGEVTETELDVLRQNDTELKNDISKIKEEQTTQNGNITKNADEITNLKNENSYLQNVVKQAFTETSASGTELNIDNTIEARMEMKLNGNSSQKTTTGKNLIKLYKATNPLVSNGLTFTRLDDNTLKINGTSEGHSWIEFIYDFKDGTDLQKTPLIKLNPDKKYVAIVKSISGTKDKKISIIFQISKDNEKNVSGSPNTPISFSNSVGIYRGWIPIPPGITFNNYILQFQLEEGTTSTDFEPYTNGASPNPEYPQEIHCVKGNNVVKISNGTEETDYKLNLGNIELNSIGTFKDYFVKIGDKWYMHKELDKFTILDCYRRFSNVTNYENNLNASNGIMGIRTTIPSRFYKERVFKPNALSTMVTFASFSLWNVTEKYKFQYVDGLLIHLSYKDLGLTEWTNVNNVELNNKIADYMKNNYGTEYFIWQLATPENIEITDTTLITQLNEISQALSRKGNTIISQSNDDLPFNLDVIALTK